MPAIISWRIPDSPWLWLSPPPPPLSSLPGYFSDPPKLTTSVSPRGSNEQRPISHKLSTAGPGGQAPSSPGCCFPSHVRSLPVPGSPRQPPQAPVANTGTIRSLGWLMQIVQEMQNSLTRKEQREQCISPSDGVKKFALLGKDWECALSTAHGCCDQDLGKASLLHRARPRVIDLF